MRPGTPGFVGDRLRQARLVRGLSKTDLARQVGVSQPTITDYEKGDVSPGPNKVERFVTVLRFPWDFFVKPLVPRSINPVHYRSLTASSKASRERAEERLGWMQEITGELETVVNLPRVDVPEFDIPEDPAELSPERIEEIAGELRWRWRLGEGAISDVLLLLENNGIVTGRFRLGARQLDAFSQEDEHRGRPFVVLSSEKESAVRSRFDAAHELGHLVLHRRIKGSVARRSEIWKLMEAQAHRFAGAFLLPAQSFAHSLSFPSLDSFLDLKPWWKVSIGVMIRRCVNLGIITRSQFEAMNEQYGRRRWKTKEPLDNQLVPEKPRVLQRAVQLVVNEGVQTREQLVSRIALPADEIEALTGLPEGYLTPAPDMVRLRWEVDANARPVPEGPIEMSRVIPFRLRAGGGDE